MYSWIRKLRGQPAKPCHEGYDEIRQEDRQHLAQGFEFCRKCGKSYLTKPRMTDLALQQAVGKH
jgi:hypothetical protein